MGRFADSLSPGPWQAGRLEFTVKLAARAKTRPPLPGRRPSETAAAGASHGATRVTVPRPPAAFKLAAARRDMRARLPDLEFPPRPATPESRVTVTVPVKVTVTSRAARPGAMTYGNITVSVTARVPVPQPVVTVL